MTSKLGVTIWGECDSKNADIPMEMLELLHLDISRRMAACRVTVSIV
ncbi:hypothetical protein [Paenibacillus tundrae]